jgi:hypothetical protein
MRAARILVGREAQEENASDSRLPAINVERLTPCHSSLQREDRFYAVTASVRIGQHSPKHSRSLIEVETAETEIYPDQKRLLLAQRAVRG